VALVDNAGSDLFVAVTNVVADSQCFSLLPKAVAAKDEIGDEAWAKGAKGVRHLRAAVRWLSEASYDCRLLIADAPIGIGDLTKVAHLERVRFRLGPDQPLRLELMPFIDTATGTPAKGKLFTNIKFRVDDSEPEAAFLTAEKS
jgi:hypothetical protein